MEVKNLKDETVNLRSELEAERRAGDNAKGELELQVEHIETLQNENLQL